ncbi:CorA family divalent cation transporter [Gracilibacillus alcaliphilus]|uniref:CorA family divalent cation transporter n=1 Tax=Gracilibacillus alcaliphilus TaxID=1401441 RepID=UPI00195603CD|nr:CorA family divalent cation transporter [Gracilibacillus alcaliphilus]MBM7676537.1 magnesium transporter [Gracilibacillus alcaliphilus]
MPITIRYQTVKKEWEKVAEEADIPEDVPFVWYDMAQPTLEESELLTSKFGFDHLVMEDIVQTVPRPKFKDYQDYQILVYHAIHEKDYRAKPINVLMKHNLLITYHHESLDYLEDVQQALSSVHPSDMEPVDMALLILDKIIDQYFDYVHEVEDQVFSFEDRHVNDTMDKYLMDDVFQIRSVLIKLKRVMLPMLELIQHLKQEGNFAKTEQQRFYIHSSFHFLKSFFSISFSASKRLIFSSGFSGRVLDLP